MEANPPEAASVILFLGKKSRWSLPLTKSRAHQDRLALEGHFEKMQQELFDETGVICPKVDIQEASWVPADEFALQINGQSVMSSSGTTMDDVVSSVSAAIRANADKLVSAELVEHYLITLRDTVPTLIDVVRSRLSIQDLVRLLSSRLAEESSIRNFPQILEEMLETST